MPCLVTQLAARYGHVLYIIKDEDREDNQVVSKMKAVERKDLDHYEEVVSNVTLDVMDQKRREAEAEKRSKKNQTLLQR